MVVVVEACSCQAAMPIDWITWLECCQSLIVGRAMASCIGQHALLLLDCSIFLKACRLSKF